MRVYQHRTSRVRLRVAYYIPFRACTQIPQLRTEPLPLLKISHFVGEPLKPFPHLERVKPSCQSSLVDLEVLED